MLHDGEDQKNGAARPENIVIKDQIVKYLGHSSLPVLL